MFTEVHTMNEPMSYESHDLGLLSYVGLPSGKYYHSMNVRIDVRGVACLVNFGDWSKVILFL